MDSTIDIPIEPSTSLVAQGWEELSRGRVVGIIFRRNAPERARLVVTFDALSAYNHRREKVSGQDLIQRCGADHLHFCYSETRWYQAEEIFRVLSIGSELASTYREVICIGHSMGAYAALIFSRALNASKVIAFAPQVSPDIEKVPFENRFSSYMEGRPYFFDDMAAGVSLTAKKYVLFDPHFSIDRQHFERLSHYPNTEAIRLPFAGHYPGYFLKECRLLGGVTMALIDDSYSAPVYRQKIRAARSTSFRYLTELSLAASQKKRFRLALNLANYAYALEPQSPNNMELYQAIMQSDALMCGLAHMLLRLLIKEHPEYSHYEEKKRLIWQQIITRVELRLKADQ